MDRLGDLHGLIPNNIGEQLHHHATQVTPGHAIVEIGSYHGKSTAYLAHGAPTGVQIYAVDPWSENHSEWRRAVTDRIPSPQRTEWERQLASVGLRDRVTPIQATSTRAAAAYNGPPIGLLYIDGDHSAHAAATDLTAWSRHLAPGARILWDDYDTPGNPGVTDTVNRLHQAGTITLHARERLAAATYQRTPMRASACIMAHPTRKEQVEELLTQLDRDVPVAWDPNPEPSPDPQRRWATGKQAWETHDPTADWHLVIQDDAIVCADMLAGLEAALTELGPDGIVSAYTGTGRPDQRNVRRAITEAEKHSHTWLHTWSLNWGVAIAAPTHTIPGMLDWCSHPNRARTNYDMRIGQYYRDILGWRTWYTHPSLADHRDTASLIGHGQGGNRKAHTHHAGSALDIDWTRHPGLTLTVPTGHRRRH